MGKFVIVVNEKGDPHFNLIATNGQIIGTSETYKSLASCKNGGIDDTTVEGGEKVKHPKFVIKTDKGGKYRFSLKARNGEVILSSQGYASKDTCLNGINSVKKNAPDAPIVEGE